MTAVSGIKGNFLLRYNLLTYNCRRLAVSVINFALSNQTNRKPGLNLPFISP